jgi:hypothetical protein
MNRLATTVIVGICVLGTPRAWAQQRPLVTEDPETLGAGQMLIEAGFDYGRDVLFPVSGLEGHLLRIGLVGVSFGVSSIAEVQVDGGIVNHLSITEQRPAPLASMLDIDGDSTNDVEDIVIATKVRILGERPGRTALGIRFATRLPNASNESGLGLDTTDFYASLLVGKTVESVRIVGNGGIAILTDPARGDRQNDVVTYGVSIARAIAQGVELVGEINGRFDTREGDAFPGTENKSAMRLGSRYTRGPVRIDGAVIIGMTPRDPSFGFTGGLTYVFNAFQVP